MMQELQRDDPWSVPFRIEAVRQIILELLADSSAGRAFLISCGDQIVGYVVLSFDFSLEYGGRNAWIDELFIRAEFRGKGLGRESVEFAAGAARDCGAKVLHLEVNRGNRAIDLYRRAGFEEHQRYLLSRTLV